MTRAARLAGLGALAVVAGAFGYSIGHLNGYDKAQRANCPFVAVQELR